MEVKRKSVSIEPYPTPDIVSQELKEILDKVSFADKIVFGRLNYSAKVKALPIKYHIKEGTVS